MKWGSHKTKKSLQLVRRSQGMIFEKKTTTACPIPARLPVGLQASLQAESERKLLLQTCPEICFSQTPYMLNPHSVSRNNDCHVGIYFFPPHNLPEISINQEDKFRRQPCFTEQSLTPILLGTGPKDFLHPLLGQFLVKKKSTF